MKYCSHCGKEINDEAVVCVHCGCAVSDPEIHNKSQNNTDDVPNIGLNILAALIPIVGLIIYLTMNDKKSRKARKIGQCALIGFCLNIFLIILFN